MKLEGWVTVIGVWLVFMVQFANKKKVKTRAAEPVPHDPELDAKIKEVDDMAESQIDDKLQAMLVSPVKSGLGYRRAQY